MTETETYRHILNVATALIAEKGFANTSMNDIVKASNLSKGGIYWHFKSKDDIIYAIVHNIFDEQGILLDDALAGEGRASERFRQLVKQIGMSLVDLNDMTPSSIDIYAMAMQKPDLLQHIKQFYAHYQELTIQLIRQGIAEGDFRAVDAEQVAFTFMATVEGIILLSVIIEQETPLDQTLDNAMSLFLQGLEIQDGDV